MSGIGQFWDKFAALGRERYQGAAQTASLVVTDVARDSAGGIIAATGTIDGVGSFTVPLRGSEATEGDTLLVSYPKDAPVGADLSYVRHLGSAAGGGLVAVNPNLPPPVFATTYYTTRLDATYGATVTRATIYFIPVEAKYRPTGYTISYNINLFSGGSWVRGTWVDQYVPHLGGAQQQAELSASLPPANVVEVRLRARYAWASAESVESDTRSFTTTSDTAPTGGAAGLTINTAIAGQALLTASGNVTLDASKFLGWVYRIGTLADGSDAVASNPQPGSLTYIAPAGTYYANVYPKLKDGRNGTPWPTVGMQAFAITAPVAPTIDTTPPPAWASAPILTGSVSQTAEGTTHNEITVTLPAGYAYPSDYLLTTVRVMPPSGIPSYYDIPYPATTLSIRDTYFGTTQVSLRGMDALGNVQASFGPSASVTLAAPTAPTDTPVVTTVSVSLGIKVQWASIAAALTYRVDRADDAAGTVNVRQVGMVEGNFFIDMIEGTTVVLPTYYYRVRGQNVGGTGPYSGWVAGTVGAFNGANIAAGTITANQLNANLIIGGKLATGVYPENYVAMEGGANDRFVGYETSRTTPTLILDYQSLRYMKAPPNDNLAALNIFNNGIVVYQAGALTAAAFSINPNGFYAYRPASIDGHQGVLLTWWSAEVFDYVDKPWGMRIGGDGTMNANLPNLLVDARWNYAKLGPISGGGQVRIGVHPVFGAAYWSLWSEANAAAGAYAILQTNDGASTLLNAASTVNLRVGNADRLTANATDVAIAVRTTIGATASYAAQMLEVVGQIESQASGNRAMRAYMVHNGVNALFDTTSGTIIIGSSGQPVYLGRCFAYNPNIGYMNFDCGPLTARGSTGAGASVLIDDARTYRSATVTNGVMYLDQASSKYLFNDGTQYIMPNQKILSNGVLIGSERAIKREIADLDDGLGYIKGLRFRSFKHKGQGGNPDPPQRQIGLIYEEAIEADPDLGGEADGANPGEHFKALDYGTVHNAGMRAIQQLAEQVAALTAEVAQLRAQQA